MKKLIAALLLAAALTSLAAAAGADAEAEPLRLPIVMYHHMSPKARLLGDYVISDAQFEHDLAYLKSRGYSAITASELLAWYDGGFEMPEKPVMITFDDGYESTFAYALPLLEKYGMRGVVNVIGSVAQQYSETEDHMLDYSHMSWEAVAAADSGGVLEVQCHTWDMHRLSPRRGCSRMQGESAADYARALSEDTEAFQSALFKYTGRRAEALALPFGFYSQETLSLARDLGFRAVMTCTERVNLLTGTDKGELFELCRYNRPSGPDSETFFAKWE